jgi:Ulp1 family protease
MAENAEVTILAHRREVSPDSSFRLNPDVWLNDSIIDNFSVWLNNLQRHRGNTEVWSFSYSATRTIVVREGNMRRPFYKAVAANSNTLLFPVSLNGVHWALIIVYTDMHKIYIVDSML